MIGSERVAGLDASDAAVGVDIEGERERRVLGRAMGVDAAGHGRQAQLDGAPRRRPRRTLDLDLDELDRRQLRLGLAEIAAALDIESRALALALLARVEDLDPADQGRVEQRLAVRSRDLGVLGRGLDDRRGLGRRVHGRRGALGLRRLSGPLGRAARRERDRDERVATDKHGLRAYHPPMPSAPTLTTQGGRYVQTSAPDGVINLGLGQPSPRLLPMATFAEAGAAQLRPDADPLILQYGTLPGYRDFRASLAAYLGEEYGDPVAPEQLLVTGGTSSALTLVSEVFAGPGDVVVSGDPTYFLAHGVFRSAKLEVVGVPVDGAGLDVDALAAKLDAGLRPAFVYCIPAFQNPTSVSLAPERARRLVALAEAHDFIVVADEPYVALRWAEARPGSLTRYDRGRGRVLSLGSFSKLLAPGLRLGWAHGAPALVERLSHHGALRSGGCLNPVIANLVHHVIDSGALARNVASLREVYTTRSRALSAALRAQLPAARFDAPSGGYFCWVDLGPEVDAAALLARASAVRFIPGSRCAVERDLSRYVRLSFSFYEPHELEAGVAALADLVSTR